jgi:hypothetical protein
MTPSFQITVSLCAIALCIVLPCGAASADSFQIVKDGKTYTCTSDAVQCEWSELSRVSQGYDRAIGECDLPGCGAFLTITGARNTGTTCPHLFDLTERNSCTGEQRTTQISVPECLCTASTACNH